MSCSSLYGIKPNYVGEDIADFSNSWWFSPIVWDVLSDKYLERGFMGHIQSIIGPNGNIVFNKINKIMNNSKNIYERVLWELSNQQIFSTKDKQLIVDCISMFLSENQNYNKSDNDGICILQREHIIGRFNEVAETIMGIDETEHPYFVFKNTSVDDGVENWFTKYDEETDEYNDCGLDEHENYIAEFVVIENGNIKCFESNLQHDYSDKLKESEEQ